MSSLLHVIQTAVVCLAVLVITANGIDLPRQNDHHDSPYGALSPDQTLSNPFEYDDFPAMSENDELFSMPQCFGQDLFEATIDDVQTLLKNGRLTSRKLVQCYWARHFQIDEYTKYAHPSGIPGMPMRDARAVLEFNPDVWAIADRLDQERRDGKARGPLHGIPFLVKDNIASKDKMETTAGSWALLGSVVPRDAFVLAKLRRAGALLMGKASLSEWADMRSNNYSEGYSARGGQTRSAYNLTLNPGGSSSGSAVAVSANLIMFSLGTETDGSVINPAERNSIVGIKPTVGLTSRAGVIPESSHQDTVGTFGRTVRDATYALDAIYGVDERDNYTSAQQSKTPKDGYANSLSTKDSLTGATFGLPWLSFWQYNDPAQNAQLAELLGMIEQAGATIINGTELPNYETIVSPTGWNWDLGGTRGFPNESEYTVVKVDFYNDIKQYLSEVENTSIKSLEDIIKYNIDHVGSEGGYPSIHPAFGSGQDGFEASLATQGVQDETYFQALAFCQKQTRELGIDAALTSREGVKIDALLAPPDFGPTYQIAAQAGYPVVTIPAGVNAVSGMPFGLSLTGTAWSEATLIKYASAIEDLQLTTEKNLYKRSQPKWLGYLERNLPVINA
ncbi:MAG: hypothetical protein M1817_002856 [Caeruleum heppii]|nr:MAG: hypothetical protein M1817_002856 [Caeruleum heppii]